MSDPYQQYTHPHPQYMQHPSPSGPPPPESEAAYYAPPDSLYQHPPYDYEAQYPYAQHIPPDQYGSHYDVSQTPRYQPPIPPPQSQSDNLLSPASAADYHPQEYYDWGRQSPHYEPVGKQGSNADYYSQHPAENETQQGSGSHLSQRSNAPELPGGEKDGGADGSGDERSVGGALLGGATGLYLGHKKGHGLLGAVGGALLGNFIGDRLEENGGKDEHHGGRHGHGHGHRHGRRRHRHHHHHGHHGHGHSHGHSHHRSRSRHDTSTSYSGSS